MILGLACCFNEDGPTRWAESVHIAINMTLKNDLRCCLFSLGMQGQTLVEDLSVKILLLENSSYTIMIERLRARVV